MPELPEVETMRRGLASIVGGRILRAARGPCTLKPIRIAPALPQFGRRVAQRSIAAVTRRGKRVVLELDNGDGIVFEPRMTGLVLIADPPDREHLRLRLDLAGSVAAHVWFWDRRGLGSVRLLTREEFERQLGTDRLGPDALSLIADELRSRLAASRRAVKVALLDQKALAGIGNLYASEILHAAGIHPTRRCDQLNRDAWIRLHAAMQQVLRDAIRHEGSTLADNTYRNALNEPGRYQNQHRVYGRAEETCRTCRRAVIERIVQAQRATFFCGVCQPLRGR